MTRRKTVIIAHQTEQYQEKKALRSQDHYPYDSPDEIENSDNYYEADEWETDPYTDQQNYKHNLKNHESLRSWKRQNGTWVQTK